MEAELYEEINGMIQLYLIRHSMTAGNLKKRYIGRTDESLCPEGIVLLKSYIQKNIYPVSYTHLDVYKRQEPEVFVISSGGSGIPIYRQLQKEHIPFAAGILYKNDIDYQLARLLAVEVITEEPFRQISDETFARAVEVMKKCKRVIVTDVPVGECNKRVEELIKLAK